MADFQFVSGAATSEEASKNVIDLATWDSTVLYLPPPLFSDVVTPQEYK